MATMDYLTSIPAKSGSFANLSLLVFCCLVCCSDTAFCKLQQTLAVAVDDPFADAPLDDPFASEPTKDHSPKPLNNITIPKDPTQHTPSIREKLLDVASELQNIKRPVWPERSVPGGLIASTCSDPLMSGKQEAILWQQLNTVDNSFWDMKLTHLVDHLDLSLPVYLDVAALDEEGISANVNVKCSEAVSLITKLTMVLTPIKLTIECRAGRVELTTMNRVVDGHGATRIYDVSPLVDGIRDGMDQLVNNICQIVHPDSWLNNGGSSTITPHIIANDSSAISVVIIVAPSAVHQQVLTLMDRLNQLPKKSSFEAALGNKRETPFTILNSSSSPATQRFDDRVMVRGGF